METIIKRQRGGVPIEEDHLTCLKCDHDHSSTRIINRYNNHGTKTMHYLCDNCQYPLRMTRTSKGFYVFSNQSAYRYVAKTWDDALSQAPAKMSDKLLKWFRNNYNPPTKKQL